MHRPKHRAPTRRRPTPQRAAAAAGAGVLLVAALVPAAYAADGASFGAPGQHHPTGKGAKPGDHGKPDRGDPTPEHDPTATNGGHALAGDAGQSPKALGPTPPPVTPYEMPFPCGETWTGSSRASHTPSPRAVDFNYAGGDEGKPVVAAAPGTVITAVVGKNKPSYGQYVVLDHGNGESSLYAHMDSVLVTVGQVVAAGQQVGTVGNTGNSHGAHLHFEERVAGAVVDAWFHGAAFAMNSALTSQNCGGTPITPVVNITDVPLAGDMYGGRSAEVMVYRRADPAAFHITRTGVKERVIKIGDPAAQPVIGDWDGNGRVDPGVREPSSRVFTLQVKRQRTTIKFGKKTDLPVAGNWDGVGPWEIGVRRPAAGKFILRMADGSKKKVALGDADDLPVTGDWDGNGTTDLGVYDRTTATFTLLMTDPLGAPYTTTVVFGTPGDVPVTGDWDGNGLTDLGVWSPATATFNKRGAVAPAAQSHRVRKIAFGNPTR
ncbi:M23 family metallopeptidase [Nocardioides anomalus]|uniref:M23 family metallopeptidase n=1 Tax=Nocardioides anomalus TaxID=2712223 RepID=A0A6G6WC50_9ACTN|nr:M23 family metallopeptidase [Nocardioides anomalus]QIG42908.1 M23 family metallopeptidase [Nocardioides anomalus]